MRRLKRASALAVSAAMAALLTTGLGVDPVAGQEEEPPAPAEATAPEAETAQVGAMQDSTTTYGPFTMAAPPQNPDGSHSHEHTGNLFQFGIEKPCNDCYITGMTANLIDETGATVGVRDDVMLHHMVLFNTDADRVDATCEWGSPFPLGGLFGQRFFASGDERTPITAPPGYGYYVGNGQFNMIYELMTMSSEQEVVSIEMDWQWTPASQAGDMTDLEPVWLDVDQCGFSTVSVPAGPSSLSYSWAVNRPGEIIGIGGHVHNGGVNIEINNDTTGQQICDSVAGYGETPLYVDHHGEEWVSSMSVCGTAAQPDFSAPISNGDQVTMTAHYEMPEAVDDQMGIVIAYVADESDQGGECNWLAELLGLC